MTLMEHFEHETHDAFLIGKHSHSTVNIFPQQKRISLSDHLQEIKKLDHHPTSSKYLWHSGWWFQLLKILVIWDDWNNTKCSKPPASIKHPLNIHETSLNIH